MRSGIAIVRVAASGGQVFHFILTKDAGDSTRLNAVMKRPVVTISPGWVRYSSEVQLLRRILSPTTACRVLEFVSMEPSGPAPLVPFPSLLADEKSAAARSSLLIFHTEGNGQVERPSHFFS